jgi:hypothetical protein
MQRFRNDFGLSVGLLVWTGERRAEQASPIVVALRFVPSWCRMLFGCCSAHGQVVFAHSGCIFSAACFLSFLTYFLISCMTAAWPLSLRSRRQSWLRK